MSVGAGNWRIGLASGAEPGGHSKYLPERYFLAPGFDTPAQKYYHAPLMSAQTVIDGLEFCGAGSELRGRLPLAGLERLQDCLSGEAGEITFLLKGGHDGRKRPVLRLEVEGRLELQCQRCLGPLQYPLRIASTLLLLRAGAAPPVEADEPEAPDCIEAGEDVDVAALIEEEILLSLPLSPRHAEGACSAGGHGSRAGGAASPFDRLAELKK
jgi:uncharacterized protein